MTIDKAQQYLLLNMNYMFCYRTSGNEKKKICVFYVNKEKLCAGVSTGYFLESLHFH